MSHTLTLQPSAATSKDTALSEFNPNNNLGLSTDLFVSEQTAGLRGRMLLQFDVSSIPASAVVVSATLTLYNTGGGAARTINIHRALTDWFEGDANNGTTTINGSTWNKKNHIGSVNWGAVGGLAGTDYASSPVASTSISGVGLYNWDVLTDVAAFVAGSVTNRGWWVLTPSGQPGSSFRSSDNAVDANTRPKLVVVYTTSEVITPSARTAVGVTVAPTVSAGYKVSPAVASAIGSRANPTVGIGGETILGVVASAVGNRVNPTALRAGGPATVAVATAVGSRSGPTSVIKGSVVLTPTPASAVGEQGGFASLIDRTLRPSAADAWGQTTVSVIAQRIWAELCEPKPLLYISDGTIKDNGQQDLLSLIDPKNGFTLRDWLPTVAQYKNGGIFSNSPLARGRRLVRREFDNTIEILDLSLRSHNQESLIQFTQDLFRWQEAAADYWVSDWARYPVYLVAKSARERNIRYAIIHTISCPQLANPYSQPFFSRDGRASIDTLTLRIERGDWEDSPPGQSQCVAVSSIRSWSVQGWQTSNTSGGGDDTITGNVLAMVQANNGDILVGTSDQAKVYRSTDNGVSWHFLFKFSGAISTDDRVRAFAKDYSGNLYAAVTGNSIANGVWKSTNNGVSWTRVKTHPSGTGYLDVTVMLGGGIVAVGLPTPSAAVSPIIWSGNQGATWSDLTTIHHLATHMAVASYPENILFTQYPGETVTSPISTFFGTDSFYSVTGGVPLTGGGAVPRPVLFYPAAGNGGLDMAVYLHRDTGGQYRRKALWAVKSHLDTNDTEIWQWPASPTNLQFAKVATIDGKVFNVLYVDPTPGADSSLRTIWAGANGEIWVSYNSGLTWALATNAPVNQIRSILRTSTGKLLAGGDNAEIFVYTGTGSQGGGNGRDETIYGGGSVVVSTYALGREATCDDEVYASNKSSFANITHVLHYNGSTYSELQFSTLPPYALLGSTAGVNKAAYFGSKTSDPNVPGGSFSGLVFNLTQKAENITVVWEYWNGSSWAALIAQDSSSGFRVGGSGSIHWVIPSNWATTAVNGITGYWVRVRTSAVAANPVMPIHGDALHPRYIYTPNLPYVEVSKSEIGGDLPAGAQIIWRNRADDPSIVLDLEADRVVCGLRSVDRGPYFNAYLNISDVQTPFGFSLTKHADGTWVNSVRSATNRALSISHSSGVEINRWNDLVTFNLANTVARDYYGTYHAFVRVHKTGAGANSWQLRLRTSFGSGGAKKDSHSAFPTTTLEWEVVDLGEVAIPTAQVSRLGSAIGDMLQLTIQGYCTGTGIGLTLFDLVLIPVDEWAVDSISPAPSLVNDAKIKGDHFLDIDSITNPKVSITATNRTDSDLIVSRYQAINNGPAILQKGSDQRFWFLIMSYETYWRSFTELAGSVQINKRQRYLGYRGRG